MVLADALIDCSAGGACKILPITGNRLAWLLIETCCFYTYLFAAIAFLAWSMIRGVCEKPDQYSDQKKAI